MQEDEALRLCTDTIDLFAALPFDLREALCRSLETVRLSRGDVLVREGDEPDAMYVVVSGRFEVRTENRAGALAEIGAGQLIGEVAFLGGGGRTATVSALRESVVMRLSRRSFQEVAASSPGIWETLTITLARRLADRNRLGTTRDDPRPRTIAILPAGPSPIPPAFQEALRRGLSAVGLARFVTSDDARALGSAPQGSVGDITAALNALEADFDYVVYVADATLSDWSKTAVRQADLVLGVALHDGDRGTPVALNDIERFAQSLHAPRAQRLVLVHAARKPISGTRWWLEARDVHMHHHVCLADDADIARLVRFVHGTATGLVMCGGGALCAAHVGLYQALGEAGVTFDIMGGTSGGAAMTAAFAMGETPEQIERQTQAMFVTGGAMRRLTLPVYSLLDQTHFDHHLRQAYGAHRVEDLWIPYFAVSTNLSSGELHCQRGGELWEAVRASGSVPALLPPFFTEDGEMLVDGGLVDNVPIRVMRDLKDGPNVVVAFHVPAHQPFAVKYDDLPSRSQLLRRLATAKDRRQLGEVPMIGAVLSRALMAQSQKFDPHVGTDDLVLVPPLAPEIGLLDWHRHGALKADAYEWAKSQLDEMNPADHPVLRRMVGL